MHTVSLPGATSVTLLPDAALVAALVLELLELDELHAARASPVVAASAATAARRVMT